jgi:hypothetical protein
MDRAEGAMSAKLLGLKQYQEKWTLIEKVYWNIGQNTQVNVIKKFRKTNEPQLNILTDMLFCRDGNDMILEHPTKKTIVVITILLTI